MSTQAPTAATPRSQSRGRATAIWVVLVVAGLLLLLSSFAIWINRVALNTGVFTDTSTSLLDNDEIRSAVANRAVDELFANVDVQAEIEGQLPEDYKGLSGAAAAGLRQASYQIVDRALEQPVFQDLFKVALRESHTTLVQVLEGGGDRVSTQGGEVTLDLRAIIIEAADRIGIGDQVVDRIPADAGRIVILRSDELDTAQSAVQLLKTLAWVLPILTLLAFGFAVWLARDRRRAVRGIGVVLVVVGLLGLAAARLTRNYVVDELVARQDDREAASNAWNILTELMRGSFRLMIVVGLLFLLAAWLAGPGRRALATRGWLAPGLQSRAWAYVALAIVGLILLLTTEVADFARLLIVAVLLALGATWIELTRRQTAVEFPDAETSAFFTDTWSRVSSWWDEQKAARAPQAPAPTPAAPVTTDVTARLASLADLHTKGELTDEEYASAKARVLAGD
ncbi:MAG TPA: SHOCT domain-containing protein [Gaiellaceae bacterium]|nr:SHOCT domain-containing protein [Gaiellaceae bacterium]